MDIRLALRHIQRRPFFALATVLTLGVGLGANVALFSVYDTAFHRALPFEDEGSLLRLRESVATADGQQHPVNMSPLALEVIREGAPALSGVVGSLARSMTLSGEHEPERVAGVGITTGWMDVMGVRPELGRTFEASEERVGMESGVVLVSHRLWESRFGGRVETLGRSIRLDGSSYRVVGVMPARFRFPYEADVWFPLAPDPSDGGSHVLAVFGRIAPGADLELVREQLELVAGRLQQEHPETNTGFGLLAVPVRESLVQEDRGLILALIGAVAFLLLLTGVNVANVLVARFLSRSQEIGISAALGASRGRQVRQFLTETLVLFLLGGGAAYLFTVWLADFLAVFIPDTLRQELPFATVQAGPRVALFAIGLSLVCGVGFGAAAAIQGSRAELVPLLQEGGRALASRQRRRVQRVLVVSQISLALMLLVGAAILVGNFLRLQSADLGFRAEDLLTLRLNLDGSAYDTPEARAGLVTGIRREVLQVPGALDAGVTTVNPICCGEWGARILPEGVELASPGASFTVNHRFISAGLIEAMRIPLVRGRRFGPRDDALGPRVILVDERLANRFWPGQDPIGRRVRPASASESDPWLEVVGVVGSVRDAGDFDLTWYMPYLQDPVGRSTNNLHVMVRTDGPAADMAPVVREAIGRAAPDLAVYDVRPMDRLYGEVIAGERLSAIVAALFAAFGLSLVALGIYGLMAYLVRDRVREIGMRVALGAGPADVRRLILQHTGGLLLAGVLIGLAFAAAVQGLMRRFLPDSGSIGLGGLAAVTMLVSAIALLGSYLPARQAARLEPIDALRR
jgi:putative ABC transport system permease protein